MAHRCPTVEQERHLGKLPIGSYLNPERSENLLFTRSSRSKYIDARKCAGTLWNAQPPIPRKWKALQVTVLLSTVGAHNLSGAHKMGMGQNPWSCNELDLPGRSTKSSLS